MKAILNFLKTITPPQMVREGMALLGVTETPGSKSNIVITNWAKETNIKADDWYNTDSIPWCSLFMAVVAQRAKKDISMVDLRALSWVNFGNAIDLKNGCLGDVAVFKRTGGGHVAVLIGYTKDKNFVYVLGGNQGDKVSIAKMPFKRLHAVRRPLYTIKPESAKQYFFDNMGDVSTNEQ
jgi:uncharacterized protein (TIGR02594 family)